MIIRGINDGHDSGGCLLRDGQVVLCSSEDRRLSVKNHAGIPEQSIAAVFRRSGIDPRDVDLVALIWNAYRRECRGGARLTPGLP